MDLEPVLAFFDEAVAAGTLVGSGTGTSAAGRLGALRNMLLEAAALLETGDVDAACGQLRDAYLRTDGAPRPPDFVTGTAAAELAALIQEAMDELDCS